MKKEKFNILRIGDIVHTVSETHKFDKDFLIAINTSDVYNGVMGKGALTPVANLKGQFKKTIKTGDLLFSEIRPANRRFAKVTATECQDFVVSTKLMVLRKFNDQVDSDYFYYCLTNQPFLDTLQRRAENRIGSFPQITFDLLSGYAFPIPPLEEQKRISKVIAIIDRKIELNKQINDNLEAMARQLYDYWFVQFDFPDENGKPYKSNGGKMVWDEKLKTSIPYNWQVLPLDKIGKFKNGINYTKGEEGNKLYKIVNVRNISSSSFFVDNSDLDVLSLNSQNGDNYLVNPSNILIARSGTPGATRLLRTNERNVIYCGFIICYALNDVTFKNYMFFTIKKLEQVTKSQSNGSILNNISQDILKRLWITLPPCGLNGKFNNSIMPIFTSIRKNQEEIEVLTKQRDELLPLLMNGQATVNYHLSDD